MRRTTLILSLTLAVSLCAVFYFALIAPKHEGQIHEELLARDVKYKMDRLAETDPVKDARSHASQGDFGLIVVDYGFAPNRYRTPGVRCEIPQGDLPSLRDRMVIRERHIGDCIVTQALLEYYDALTQYAVSYNQTVLLSPGFDNGLDCGLSDDMDQ